MFRQLNLRTVIMMSVIATLIVLAVMQFNGSGLMANSASAESNQKQAVSTKLQNVRFMGDTAKATVCLQLPSVADWLPEATANVDGKEIAAIGWQLVKSKDAETYKTPNRCYAFEFQHEAFAKNNASLKTVTVTRLVSSIPEQVSKQECESAKLRLAKSAKSIVVECKLSEQGSYYAEMLNKAADVSDDVAYKEIADSFAEVVAGPWVNVVGQ